jgi:ABC-type uncharacterized transport system fused permease/ATPase subunit
MQIFDNNIDNPDQRISEDLRLFIFYAWSYPSVC